MTEKTEEKVESLPTKNWWQTLQAHLFKPVDIASIVILRIMFGAILMWEVWRYFENDWIRIYYIVRDFYFKYYGFAWVQPWPGDWMYVHFLFPFRHWLYPGDVHWNNEGHRFAWRMKLRSKRADATFMATDPKTGESWEIDQSEYLSSKQRAAVGRWPEMVLQFAHFMAERLKEEGYEEIEIRVRSEASLNGRKEQLLFDPEVDLVKEKWTYKPKPWILPLTEPLPVPDD